MISAAGTGAVLFDLDGTLIDSAPELGAAADQMRTARGLASLPMERYRPMAGAGARGMLGVAFGITPDAPDFPPLREEFFLNYEARMMHTRVFEGVAELVAALCAHGLQWGVVTNKSVRFTEPLTRAMPLFATARAIVSGDTTPYAKPHPEPLFEAARRLGVPPERCIYVGDDERDIIAARAAGMVSIVALWGYRLDEDDPVAWQGDAMFDSPHDLLDTAAWPRRA